MCIRDRHHMLPFYGKIMLAYSPNGRVFGISKLVRLVEKHSKSLQIQERMTKNIADELYSQGVKGVAVIAEAEHLCMKMRGVRNDANVTSAAFRGIYEKKEEKENIIKLIKNSLLLICIPARFVVIELFFSIKLSALITLVYLKVFLLGIKNL